MQSDAKICGPRNDPDSIPERLHALLRMVAFARDDARELEADFPAHCLDVAAAALIAELRDRGLPVPFEADTRQDQTGCLN